MGFDNRIAFPSTGRWVSGPHGVKCFAKMVGDRHGILSSGHRAAPIVATTVGTDVRFSL